LACAFVRQPAVSIFPIDMAQLTADLATANNTIASHNNRITNIESNTVLALDGYLMLSTNNGYDTAEFTDINVQINNNSGSTDGAINGLGNLIIGYNETSASAPSFCSDPQFTHPTTCSSNGQIWDNNVRRGSHNLILGASNSYDDYAGIVSGYNNIINNGYASVLGGSSNKATGNYSSVSGGHLNDAQGYGSSVIGGYNRDTPVGVTGDVSEYDWKASTLSENY